MSRLLLVVSLCLPAALAAVGSQPLQAPPPRRIPVEELVEQLGTGPVAQREEAEKRLSAMTVDPPPEVLAALKSSNLDQRERAARVAQAMRWNVAVTKLPRGQKFAEQGRIDLFVAATAVWDVKSDDDRLWVPAQDLGRLLIGKAEMKGDRKPHNCPSTFRDFATYKRLFGPVFTRVDERYVCPDERSANPVLFYREAIQAAGVDCLTSLSYSLIVSRGSVRVEKIIQTSVIFANGDVTVPGGLSCSVIVCDGDVTVADESISKTLIIARGSITVKDHVGEATLIAGGKVTIGPQRKVPGERISVIKENETNPLGFVTFFELHRVGLEVKVADKAVQVSAVAAGKACEKAGLKTGDAILEVGGKKPADAESLRRLLRDALAVGDATLKVRRGNDTLTLKLTLPD